jgi:general secretion pathway protein E/type IV pilus assembly protein PilB
MKIEGLVSLSSYNAIPEGEDQYSAEYCEKNEVLKLSENDHCVEIGVTEATPRTTMETLLRFHRAKEVIFCTIDKIDLVSHLGNNASSLSSPDAPTVLQSDERLLLDKLANDAPIVNLVNTLCIDAIRSDASDIHIEACENNVRVRYRVDGVLKTIKTIEKSKFPGIASRIKIMANLNIMERRLPQDGRMTVDIGNDTVDMRVSIIPTAYGESIVLRLFNKKKQPLQLDQLGFSASDITALRSFYQIQHGLILVTGPTGSGKTTTLNAMLREMVDDRLNIIAIEDPVEYMIDGVNQIQTNDTIGLSFETILRRVLRQDPNVIMVGEIRDPQTAELAIRSALTGHLVLSTLHTNDSISVISRLRNMGIEPYLIGSVLRGAVAQRLVRSVCPFCAAPYQPTAMEMNLLQRYGIENRTLQRGSGCSKCGESGFLGRTVIAEVFTMDEKVELLVAEGANHAAIEHYLRQKGWKTLAEDGLQKVASGVTTFEELYHEVAF